ncbi:hypothetical protein RRG08_065415 [Elysia crispata]|uniref:Uncharacterized protein n=1 Tax=Elysia crispata TaxID=231223 RepID=A0AAE0ZM88_9GAST|nr:hypothetical protein RRG08_065415 [Elysia crispata]
MTESTGPSVNENKRPRREALWSNVLSSCCSELTLQLHSPPLPLTVSEGKTVHPFSEYHITETIHGKKLIVLPEISLLECGSQQ